MMANGAAQRAVRDLPVWRLEFLHRRSTGKMLTNRACCRGGRLPQCRHLSDEKLHDAGMRRLGPFGRLPAAAWSRQPMACVSERSAWIARLGPARRRPTIRGRLCRGIGACVMELLRLNILGRVDKSSPEGDENSATIIARGARGSIQMRASFAGESPTRPASIPRCMISGEISKRTPYIGDAEARRALCLKDQHPLHGWRARY